jgi:hypothetical protein
MNATMLVGLWLTSVAYAQGERAGGGQPPLSRADESAADKAVDIGSRLELFVDRLLVDHLDHVEFRLHRPQRVPLGKSPLVGSYATVIKHPFPSRPAPRPGNCGPSRCGSAAAA